MDNYFDQDDFYDREPVMIDFDCPVCGDSADEFGCINKCDPDAMQAAADIAATEDPWGYEDAAMEAGLFGGDC